MWLERRVQSLSLIWWQGDTYCAAMWIHFSFSHIVDKSFPRLFVCWNSGDTSAIWVKYLFLTFVYICCTLWGSGSHNVENTKYTCMHRNGSHNIVICQVQCFNGSKYIQIISTSTVYVISHCRDVSFRPDSIIVDKCLFLFILVVNFHPNTFSKNFLRLIFYKLYVWIIMDEIILSWQLSELLAW